MASSGKQNWSSVVEPASAALKSDELDVKAVRETLCKCKHDQVQMERVNMVSTLRHPYTGKRVECAHLWIAQPLMDFRGQEHVSSSFAETGGNGQVPGKSRAGKLAADTQVRSRYLSKQSA